MQRAWKGETCDVKRHFGVETVNRNARLDMRRRLEAKGRNGSLVQLSRWRAHQLWVPERCHQRRTNQLLALSTLPDKAPLLKMSTPGRPVGGATGIPSLLCPRWVSEKPASQFRPALLSTKGNPGQLDTVPSCKVLSVQMGLSIPRRSLLRTPQLGT